MTNDRHRLKKQNSKDSSKSTVAALYPVLEDLVLDYVDHTDETFNSTMYSRESVGPSLFENRLPVFTLLQLAARGEYKEVDAMLTKNPLLLLERDTVTDYSGRKHVKRTVYQIALGACDSHVKDAEGNIVQKGMIEMIEEHFKKLPGMTTKEIDRIMQTQREEQFPALYAVKEADKEAADLKALKDVMSAIDSARQEDCRLISSVDDEIHEIIRSTERSERRDTLLEVVQSVMQARPDVFETAFNVLKDYLTTHNFLKEGFFNVDLLKALYQFRNHVEPKDPQTTGKHFNLKLLSLSAQCYDANYVGFGNDAGSPKNRMYWQKVLGYIERFVPACDAQIIAQGILFILEQGEESVRSLQFTYAECNYFPLGSHPTWEVGYNCAAGVLAGCGRSGGAGGRRTWNALFSKLMSSKNISPGAYAASRQSATEEPLRNCSLVK